MDDVHFSSKDQTWRTPAEIWDRLQRWAGGRALHDAAPARHPAPFPSVLALYSTRQHARDLFESTFGDLGWTP